MSDTQRYQTEVDVITTDGRMVTCKGDGIGPAGLSGDQILNSAEAAAYELNPGSVITGSRARTAD